MKTFEELQQELQDNNIGLADRSILEISRDIFHAHKAFESLWKEVKDEAFDHVEDTYSKEEAEREGITYRSQARFNTKDYEKDAEYAALKQAMTSRKKLLEAAYEASEKDMEFITTDGEVIENILSKKGVKILTFK